MQLSFKQKEFIKSQLWWSPLSKTPYLIKGGVYNSVLLLFLTNFKEAWICRKQKHQLMQQKQKYNKTLQVKDKQLLNLLDLKLSNFIQNGKYDILLLNENTIKFTIKVPLNIYNFVWDFELKRIKDYDIPNMIINQLMNPMLNTINAQSRYLKLIADNLTNAQKAKLNNQQQMKKVLELNEIQQNPINNLEEASKFFLKNYSKSKVNLNQKEQKEQKLKEVKSKEKKQTITTLQQSYANQIILKEKLQEKKKKQESKPKKLTFI